jgi:hypothetical protein
MIINDYTNKQAALDHIHVLELAGRHAIMCRDLDDDNVWLVIYEL